MKCVGVWLIVVAVCTATCLAITECGNTSIADHRPVLHVLLTRHLIGITVPELITQRVTQFVEFTIRSIRNQDVNPAVYALNGGAFVWIVQVQLQFRDEPHLVQLKNSFPFVQILLLDGAGYSTCPIDRWLELRYLCTDNTTALGSALSGTCSHDCDEQQFMQSLSAKYGKVVVTRLDDDDMLHPSFFRFVRTSALVSNSPVTAVYPTTVARWAPDMDMKGSFGFASYRPIIKFFPRMEVENVTDMKSQAATADVLGDNQLATVPNYRMYSPESTGATLILESSLNRTVFEWNCPNMVNHYWLFEAAARHTVAMCRRMCEFTWIRITQSLTLYSMFPTSNLALYVNKTRQKVPRDGTPVGLNITRQILRRFRVPLAAVVKVNDAAISAKTAVTALLKNGVSKKRLVPGCEHYMRVVPTHAHLPLNIVQNGVCDHPDRLTQPSEEFRIGPRGFLRFLHNEYFHR